MKSVLMLGAAALLAAGPAVAADEVVSISFQERETDDSFRVYNSAPCPGVRLTELSIDFSTAAGNLFFDADPGGAGYSDEQFDRFVVLSGAEHVAELSRLDDGSKVLTLRLTDFETGDELRFGIDVDDREGPVPGTDDDATARELERTSVAARLVNAAGEEQAERSAFGPSGNAVIQWTGACPE